MNVLAWDFSDLATVLPMALDVGESYAILRLMSNQSMIDESY